jgi:ATP-dependent helicase/nuclease subunit B
LIELDPLETEMAWEEWTELFRLTLEKTMLPVESEPHRGVQVLDAMGARGLRFRALFIMGLNEQVFPRFIREDAFLRDHHRTVLASTLGFIIEEKLAGHDEERLLFELLCRAASHRLYLSYQRADEEGRTMTPSIFVTTALRNPRFVAAEEIAISRRLTTRVTYQPQIQEMLPAQDLTLTYLLHGQDAGPLLDHTGQSRQLCEHGLAVQTIRERDSPELGSFDGLLGAQADTGSLFDQGISPTALERYASCPFRYFAEKMLRLRPVRIAKEDHLPALNLGLLMHDALRVTYQRLIAQNWPDVTIETANMQSTIATAAAEVFATHAAARGTGHALLWTLTQEQIVGLVRALVAADEEEYRLSGFRPHSCETVAEGLFPLGAAELRIHGKLDRVDLRSDPPALRIVDYKFKQGREMHSQERNLILSAVRGFKLQPPLYGAMSLPSLPSPSEVQFLYLAPHWEPPIARSIFDISKAAGGATERIKQTISTLVQGIERREFFILPDGYCEHCEFTAACQRHDQSMWWRSHRSPEARALRRLRKQQVNDD